MHFISQIRYNSATSCEQKYYRIKETFRDKVGKVRSRILLNVGFVSGLSAEDIRDIGKGLTYMSEHRAEYPLFENAFSRYSQTVREHIDKYWTMMIEQGSVDIVQQIIEESTSEARRMIDIESMEHTEAREVGAEWLCLQAIRQLELDKMLSAQGWSDARIKAAISLLITRTIYSPSELKSLRIMQDNSAVCELVYGKADLQPSYKSIYRVAPELYKIKEEIEQHLCSKTDTLFNQTNRIMLFDLTNFYFEGRKEKSKKASFGRSKEKRTDCKLLVLALCINSDGFIRYSSVLEGNISEPSSLPEMIENVIAKSPAGKDSASKSLVVLDAGIATERNLELIKEKGYNYLCVSRKKLKDYELQPEGKTVIVHDHKKQEIRLTEVLREEGGDYFLQVNSPAKELKESSMNRQFKERFEAELQKAKEGLTKKGGTKNYEKVIKRVERARERYPSIARNYEIIYTQCTDNAKLMSDITWYIKSQDNKVSNEGIYFLRTNIETIDEKTTWDYYNLIREIECTNRQLKSDLNLRPIYHQKDEHADAHLFFGLLAYWVVNTIRYQLKEKGINHYWSEIVRIMSTQKVVTTKALNALDEKVETKICSEPTKDVTSIYKALKYKDRPFKKIKICSTQQLS
ncbi:MAG: IS1634 family transposase [Bacteroidales bacterium]